jgi:hypothetical protein
MKTVVSQFIPIILIFLFLADTNRFKKFSRTIFGRIVAVGLVLFYASVDKYLGALVCGIIIFYFQNESIEPLDVLGYDIEIDDIGFNLTDDNVNGIEIEETTIAAMDDGYYIDNGMDKKPNKLRKTSVGDSLKKVLSLNAPKFENLEDEFRIRNCEKGVLKYKNMKVKNEMAEHIFPEMKYDNVLCNPCAKTCDISITEKKLITESKIKSTNNKP